MTYEEIKNTPPILTDGFFAFSKEQFEEGLIKHNIDRKDIRDGQNNLYGTNEGIDKFYQGYADQKAQITAECTPQEVYDDEYINYECGYTGDDSEALECVHYYFGTERDNEVKRKYNDEE